MNIAAYVMRCYHDASAKYTLTPAPRTCGGLAAIRGSTKTSRLRSEESTALAVLCSFRDRSLFIVPACGCDAQKAGKPALKLDRLGWHSHRKVIALKTFSSLDIIQSLYSYVKLAPSPMRSITHAILRYVSILFSPAEPVEEVGKW